MLLQCLHISNHHDVRFKYLSSSFVSDTSIELKNFKLKYALKINKTLRVRKEKVTPNQRHSGSSVSHSSAEGMLYQPMGSICSLGCPHGTGVHTQATDDRVDMSPRASQGISMIPEQGRVTG